MNFAGFIRTAVAFSCGYRPDVDEVAVRAMLERPAVVDGQPTRIAACVANLTHQGHSHFLVLKAFEDRSGAWRLGEAFVESDPSAHAVGILRNGGVLVVGGIVRAPTAAEVTLLVPGGPQDTCQVTEGTFIAAVSADHPDEFQLLTRDSTGHTIDFQSERRTHDERWSDFSSEVRVQPNNGGR